MYPLADLHWYPGQELLVETNSTGEKSKLLSQLERDGKFWVQKNSRRIRPIHSLCRHRSDHGLFYAMACGNKTKSPDGHRKWDLDYDADWGHSGGNSCCNQATGFSRLTRSQECQQQSYKLFSRAKEVNKSHSTNFNSLPPLHCRLHTSTAQPHKWSYQQTAPVKESVEK